MSLGRRCWRTAGLGLAAGTVVSVAVAQELGTTQRASITSELVANDNVELRADETSALIWNNFLGYGTLTRTPVDEFEFDAQVNLRVQERDDEGTDFDGFDGDDVNTGLRFERTVDDTEIGARARYRRDQLTFFDPVTDPDPDGTFDLTTREGVRESLRLSANLGLNTDGPIGFTGGASYSNIRFLDVDAEDPDEFEPRERASVNGEVEFRFSPVLSLTTGAAYAADIFEDSDTDRESVRADVGANVRINPRLSARARLGFSRVDTERGDGEEQEEGAVGSLTFSIDEPRGSYSFGTATELDENGQRVTVFVGRAIQTDDAELDGQIGLSTNEDTDVNLVGNIAYSQSFRVATIGASFVQAATVDDDGDNVLNTIGRLSYNYILTRRSQLGLNASAAVSQNLDDDNDDDERYTLSATYTQALTPDWSWRAGYRARFEARDGRDDGDLNSSNEIFAGITRSFSSTR